MRDLLHGGTSAVRDLIVAAAAEPGDGRCTGSRSARCGWFCVRLVRRGGQGTGGARVHGALAAGGSASTSSGAEARGVTCAPSDAGVRLCAGADREVEATAPGAGRSVKARPTGRRSGDHPGLPHEPHRLAEPHRSRDDVKVAELGPARGLLQIPLLARTPSSPSCQVSGGGDPWPVRRARVVPGPAGPRRTADRGPPRRQRPARRARSRVRRSPASSGPSPDGTARCRPAD